MSKRWRRTTVFTHVLQKETLKKGILKKIKHTRHIHPSIIIHPSIHRAEKADKTNKVPPPQSECPATKTDYIFFYCFRSAATEENCKRLKNKNKEQSSYCQRFCLRWRGEKMQRIICLCSRRRIFNDKSKEEKKDL